MKAIIYYNQIKQLLSSGDIVLALELLGKLAEFIKNKNFSNSTIHLLFQFKSLERELITGVITFEDATIKKNKISQEILVLLNNLKLEEEIGQGVSNEHDENVVIKILMLTANPACTAILNLNDEHSAIISKLQSVQNNFSIIKNDAITISLFKESIDEIKPDILHFSGHGHDDGLMVQNDDFNGVEIIPSNGLKALFSNLKRQNINVKSVILNACYTEDQSKAIAQNVDYVIGTTIAVGDKIAKNFSTGYYFKIAQNGLDFENAFRSGVVKAEMSGAQKSDFIMFKNGNLLEI